MPVEKKLPIRFPRKGVSVWREDIDCEKKLYNLNFENYVLFCRQNWGLKPRAQPLRETWGTASKSLREEMEEFLQHRPDSGIIKRLLLIK